MSSAAGPRIVAVAGSPRVGGNSERLLDECLAGVTAAGGLAEKIVIAEHAIAPCTGCGACTATGVCVVADDMSAIMERLDAADGFAVASPVYFASVPATLKAFFDRLQPYWARRYILKTAVPSPRPGAVLLVRGGGDPYGHSCAVTCTKSALSVLGGHIVHELVVEGPDAPDDITKYPDALAEARRIGAALVAAIGSRD